MVGKIHPLFSLESQRILTGSKTRLTRKWARTLNGVTGVPGEAAPMVNRVGIELARVKRAIVWAMIVRNSFVRMWWSMRLVAVRVSPIHVMKELHCVLKIAKKVQIDNKGPNLQYQGPNGFFLGPFTKWKQLEKTSFCVFY